MLWSEFQEGTQCKTTEYNYKVYEDLDTLYMCSDLTKEDIYTYGRKLIDNSLTPEEIQWNAERMEDIEREKEHLELCKKYYSIWADCKKSSDPFGWERAKFWKDACKRSRQTIKRYREMIYH